MAIPHEPHFFQPLLPGFETGVSIPIAFYSKHIHGQFHQNLWTLRSDASDRTWQVQQQERTLTRGWKEFTEAHNLRVGDIVIFKLECNMVFHVTPMGRSCTEIQYTYDEDDEPNVQNITGGRASLASYSFDYCFRADVTESSLQEDKLDLPPEACTCTALNRQLKTAKLVNIAGDAWPVALRFNESAGHYYVKGWRKFCTGNKCSVGDALGFNVFGDGKTPPLLCVFAPRKEVVNNILKTWRASSSTVRLVLPQGRIKGTMGCALDGVSCR